MPPLYSPEGTSIAPYTLTDAQHAAIGRLIRACAEMEDIINLRLAQLADTSEGITVLFLGRTGLASRLQLLKRLSDGKGDEAIELHRQAFENEDFANLVEMRNTVAHGRLLGVTAENRVAFVVHEIQGIDSQRLHMTVHAYEHDAFAIVASLAEYVLPQIEVLFELRSLREKRRAQDLAPHNKSQPKARRPRSPAHQPQASQELARQAKLDRKAAQRAQEKNRKKD
jgi:hypothetical protein